MLQAEYTAVQLQTRMRNEMERKRLVERVIHSYQREYPHTRRFKLLREHQRLINRYLAEDDYIGLAILYGINFVQMLVQLLEQEEDFEQCTLIQRQLEDLYSRIRVRDDYKALMVMIHQT